MNTKNTVAAMMAVASVSAMGVAAHADTTFTGTTTGSFSGGNAGTYLTFTNGGFSGASSGGFLGIGGGVGANLGNISVATGSGTPLSGTFTLVTTFSAPVVIAGSNVATNSATIVGNVTSLGNGGAFINFGGSNSAFTFTNPALTGSFTFTPNNASIFSGRSQDLTGTIIETDRTNVTPAPEPSAIASFGLGGFGLLGLMVRARKARKTAA